MRHYKKAKQRLSNFKKWIRKSIKSMDADFDHTPYLKRYAHRIKAQIIGWDERNFEARVLVYDSTKIPEKYKNTPYKYFQVTDPVFYEYRKIEWIYIGTFSYYRVSVMLNDMVMHLREKEEKEK